MPRDKAERVDDNRVVTLTFTLEDETGAPITEAPPAAPYVYLHGHGQLLSAFEEALDATIAWYRANEAWWRPLKQAGASDRQGLVRK